MKAFEREPYKVFELFNERWGLVASGTEAAFNCCTLSWGSLGTIWGNPGSGRPIVTVYVHRDRYTWEFLKENGYFTVSFFEERYRKALGLLGSRSGRDGDKVAAAGLTPKTVGESVAFAEAEQVFYCRKLYQGPFEREGLAEEIRGGIYADWEPHWMFVGEILEVLRPE